MDVEVLLFAALRDAVGDERLTLRLAAGATGADLRADLVRRYPRWRGLLESSRLAQGAEFLDERLPLDPVEPVAIIPPVSGGSEPLPAALTREPLDVAYLEAAAARETSGALCVFVGTVRSPNEGKPVLHIDYEAHEPMAEARMNRLVETARSRWPGAVAYLHHRLGRLAPGEASVAVVVSHPHRGEAFEACRFLIEALKADVPIWKHEFFEDGSRWVGAPGEC